MTAPDGLGWPWKKMGGISASSIIRSALRTVRRFVADQNAATAIEYCLIATGIALGIFVAVAGIEARINAELTAINGSLK
jgi:pilus assembly protein Flp/PilA